MFTDSVLIGLDCPPLVILQILIEQMFSISRKSASPQSAYSRVGHSTKVFLKPVISMAILVTDDESIGIFDQL